MRVAKDNKSLSINPWADKEAFARESAGRRQNPF
jgi:hypothetical protein